jgi:hypothetical protein
VLVRHLPPEAATMTGLRGEMTDEDQRAAERTDPGTEPWSRAEMLTAAVLDALRRLEWAYHCVNGKGTAPPPPDPLPRPGVGKPRRRVMTVAEYKRLTGQAPPMHLIKPA